VVVMVSKKVSLLVSEVCEGDFDDITDYNQYRMKKEWRCFRVKPSEKYIMPMRCILFFSLVAILEKVI